MSERDLIFDLFTLGTNLDREWATEQALMKVKVHTDALIAAAYLAAADTMWRVICSTNSPPPHGTNAAKEAILQLTHDAARLALAEHDVIVRQQGFDAGFEGAERAAFNREREYMARTSLALEEREKKSAEVRDKLWCDALNYSATGSCPTLDSGWEEIGPVKTRQTLIEHSPFIAEREATLIADTLRSAADTMWRVICSKNSPPPHGTNAAKEAILDLNPTQIAAQAEERDRRIRDSAIDEAAEALSRVQHVAGNVKLILALKSRAAVQGGASREDS